MLAFRVEQIDALARQLAFTPVEPRAAQMAAAEVLLHAIDPAKGYPLDFVVYRITGYHPKRAAAAADLITGLALQHDLGLLIEQVADTLDLRASAMPEPVLDIADVTARFDVTSKTIQRWRRRGLPARRFTFADGKRRVGFLLSSVEQFVAGQRGGPAVERPTTHGDASVAAMVVHARRLATAGRCTAAELARRVGRRHGRSPMAVLHTLRKHDADHPDDAVLPLVASPVAAVERQRMCDDAEAGVGVSALAAAVGRPRSTVHAVLVQHRAERLTARRIRFVDDPLYHGPNAATAVAAILDQGDVLPAAEVVADGRVPRDLPPYLRDLYRTPLLSPARERALFLAFNYHKCVFAVARRRLDPELASARDLAQLQRYLADATAVKNEILQANLRLVVSVARRHVRPTVGLMDLISEGNITLMRAVEGFDPHKGFRFSTYATLALMKGFARAVPLLSGRTGTGRQTVADVNLLAGVPADGRRTAVDRHVDHDHVRHLLGRLDDRQRQVIAARFGLSTHAPVEATCEQVGRQLGLSKRRVRQIEQSALAVLRDGGTVAG